MSFLFTNRRVGGFSVAFGFVTSAIVTGAACSSSGPTKGHAQGAGAATPHAIHVFINQANGQRRQVDFGPGTEVSFPTNVGGALAPSSTELGRHHILPMVSDAGTLQGTAPPTIEDPGTTVEATAWALVARATDACEGGTAAMLPPWSEQQGLQSWYVNGPFPESCAPRLALEQDLVCVADKLAQIADAVGDVTWPALPPTLGCESGTYEYGEADAAASGCAYADAWDIPPQADGDRFIVRDLAIHTLAMIPVVESYVGPLGESCVVSFAKVANQTLAVDPVAANAATISGVFGVFLSGPSDPTIPVFPPSNAPYVGNMPAIARTALDLDAQIHRSGGRLLHDLIRRDVYSDLAAAAQQAGQASDPGNAGVNAWGQNTQGASPYGTISHAARVLLGRWEIGDKNSAPADGMPASVADPECEGITELGLLSGALGTDFVARSTDRAIRTPGEQTAAEFVERSGLVVPAGSLPSSGDASALRAILIAQLQLEEQVQNNLTSPPAVSALSNILSTSNVSDAELIFAFQRALNTWTLATNQAPSAGSGSCTGSSPLQIDAGVLPAGLMMATYPSNWPSKPGQPLIVDAATQLCAIVVNGGLARSHLATDPMARVGGMTEASQCADVTLNYWDEWGNTSVSNPAYPVGVQLPPVVFQDAFETGQAFERRLNLVQAAANTVPGYTDPGDVARGGIAELKTWAGATIVHAWPRVAPLPAPAPTSFVVRVGGMSYVDDFGLSTPASGASLPSVAAAFGFVYGPPWVAECAAGVRPDCPTGFFTQYVETSTSANPVSATNATSSYASTGVVGDVFDLAVPITGAAPMFTPPIGDPATPAEVGESHLYMVRLNDPSSSTGEGRVLGTIVLRGTFSAGARKNPDGGAPIFYQTLSPLITGFVDAPMQRELVHDAIDLGSWVGASAPSLGELSAAQPAGYCVDGVPRNLFVPLDNELVSGTQTYEDSWQAYLSLAQTAANTADALGRALIDQDLAISENQQAAEEALANLCGDFGSLSSATVAPNGKVTADSADTTTQACLGNGPNAQPVDVVFLGSLPSNLQSALTDAEYTRRVKLAINCGGSNGTPQPPTANTLCQEPNLTAAGLGKTPPVAATPDPCSDLTSNIIPSLRTGFHAQQYLQDLSADEFSPSTLQLVASLLKMTVDLSNHWQVTYANQPIMDSADPAYWPGCIAAGGCTTVRGVPEPLAEAWSQVFRDCADPTNDSSSTPLGCDGSAAAELNLIKWRVMQAMWMIAASSGEIPAGMITQPIPAVFTDWCADADGPYGACAYANGHSADDFVPPGTVTYYTGTPVDADPSFCGGLGKCQTLDGGDTRTNGADIRAAGPIFPVDQSFNAFENSSSEEVPYWYRTAYSSTYATMVRHIFTANTAAVVDQCEGLGEPVWSGGKNPFAPPSAQCGQQIATQVPLVSLVGAASGLDAIECVRDWGEPKGNLTPPQAFSEPWWYAVTDVKLGISKWADDGTPLFYGCKVNGHSTGNVLATGAGQAYSETSAANGWDNSLSTPGLLPVVSPDPGDDSPKPADGWTAWPGGNAEIVTPSCWQPPVRALSFSGYGAAPNGTCGAASLLLQATALACASNPATGNLSSPPSITHLADIPALQAWLSLAKTTIENSAGNLYAQEIPPQVVTDFNAGTIGSGAIGGARGQAILAMESQIQSIPTAWIALASDLGQIGEAIQIANVVIVGNHLSEESADGALALSQLGVQASMAAAADAFIGAILGGEASAIQSDGASLVGVPIAALSLETSDDFGTKELAATYYSGAVAGATEQNQVEQALALLAQTVIPLWADAQKQVYALRSAVAGIDSSAQTVALTQGQAAYQLAIGTGSDFANVAGEEVPIPVDTVLRRQASATLQRYQSALTNAKALAYMARRAIEQRIGVPLDALTQQVGPVDAPASWADDICSLQGVNYSALSSAAQSGDGGTDATTDQAAISGFADGWVGDYVAKLSNFVTYYNVQYPSHQGEDVAALSLRYDLLPPVLQCTTQAPNLLKNSGDLSVLSDASWQLTPCDPSLGKCLAVVGEYSLASPQDGPSGPESVGTDAGQPLALTQAGGGLTWLLDVPSAGAAPSATDGGSSEDGGGEAGSPSAQSPSGPANFVVQRVKLSAGSYVLSWWDQARDANANVVAVGGTTLSGGVTSPPQFAPPTYVAEVFDDSWGEMAIQDAVPFRPAAVDASGVTLWSTRHVLSFSVANEGLYFVGFSASDRSAPMGSVAIADVQLEQAASGEPSTYVATTGTTMVSGTDCPMSDADLRAAFVHSCDANNVCYYDLDVPFVIDTSILDGSPLSAKLADGNYNYRQITLALNLVGTGVHSCAGDPSPNCYGSGYIQYTLRHDAQSAGIVGYDGNSRPFDFGVATIAGGKALAAEQYVTMPLSANNTQLIGQPGIEHVEFGGRPLDGTYSLRIQDSPDLNWAALEDVQFIVDYEYWSGIQVTEDARHPKRLRRAPIKPIMMRAPRR